MLLMDINLLVYFLSDRVLRHEKEVLRPQHLLNKKASKSNQSIGWKPKTKLLKNVQQCLPILILILNQLKHLQCVECLQAYPTAMSTERLLRFSLLFQGLCFQINEYLLSTSCEGFVFELVRPLADETLENGWKRPVGVENRVKFR